MVADTIDNFPKTERLDAASNSADFPVKWDSYKEYAHLIANKYHFF